MTRIAGGLFLFLVLAGMSLPAQAEIPANQLNEAERRGGWKLLNGSPHGVSARWEGRCRP